MSITGLSDIENKDLSRAIKQLQVTPSNNWFGSRTVIVGGQPLNFDQLISAIKDRKDLTPAEMKACFDNVKKLEEDSRSGFKIIYIINSGLRALKMFSATSASENLQKQYNLLDTNIKKMEEHLKSPEMTAKQKDYDAKIATVSEQIHIESIPNPYGDLQKELEVLKYELEKLKRLYNPNT